MRVLVMLCAFGALFPHLVGGSVTIQAENFFVDQRDGQQEDETPTNSDMRIFIKVHAD